MCDEALKKYSDVFEKYLIPDKNDEPVLMKEDLRDALAEAGISSDMTPKFLSLMDPENTGMITFEKFVSICMENKKKENEDASRGESSAGGFEGDSDENYEEEIPKNPTMERMFAMFSQDNNRITVESLEKAGKTVNVSISKPDLEKMMKMCPDRASFVRMWRQLE